MALFVDAVTIECKSGNGGNGCVSFHREKFVQAGGPDGGDGGRGGDIVFWASEHMHTLMDFRFKHKFIAPSGADGMANRKSGKSGEALTIEVPRGTVVKDKLTGKVLLDLFEPGSRKVLLRGGNGGFGNQHFATPTRQAPNFARPGERTEPRELTLELKSIADVGLVGFPNVGKSTILSVVTDAKPKIANYHFTTLQPNLGIVKQDDDSFVIADIPGLIEGAAQGVGLGHDFLRHVERTRMLVHVLDISGSEGRDPLQDYDAIMQELTQYGELSKKPMIIAANKTDLCMDETNLDALKEKLKDSGIQIFDMSAVTRKGLQPLLRAVTSMLRELPPVEAFYEEELLIEKPADSFTIKKQNDLYLVTGPSIDKLIASVNFGDEDSLNWFHKTLRKWGIIDALREAGAKEGDTVSLNDMEFDFID
ncbi:GTPase ObgE [Eubacteriales bacterium OttesenSCG-928-N13]|nr:GTPase ObgE [Eubacteriales bacterium OttesenSCG-928-N13]